MRLGEIKKIVKSASDDNHNLTIQNEVLYNGQAYLVSNFRELTDAINILKNQKWNDIGSDQIQDIIAQNTKVENNQQLTQDEFNRLSTYINALNQKVPLFYSILEQIDENQNEQTINLKLPENTKSLTDLSELNKRLEKLFKLFNIDGEFSFEGFDKGTAWYILLIKGYFTYQSFIMCLQISQEFLKTRREYYESETAKLDYEAALKSKDEFKDDELKKYIERRLELNIEKGIRDALDKITTTNGASTPELASKLIIATRELIKEMGEGVEFHLSLNPPAYAKEQNGTLEINYKSIQEERTKRLNNENKTKQIKETNSNEAEQS